MISTSSAQTRRSLFSLCLLAVLGLLTFGPAAAFAQAPARPAPASPAAPLATDNSASSAPAASYVLSPNDAVQIEVYQEDDMRTQAVVSKEGTINLPLIGTVKVSGLTQSQARDLVTEKLRPDYYKNPQVSVTVLRFSRKRFTILGQVNRPGSYEFPDQEGTLPLLEAIAMAGGYTRIAAPNRIQISRHVGSTNQVIKKDAKKLASDSNAEPFNILPNDSITVPEGVF